MGKWFRSPWPTLGLPFFLRSESRRAGTGGIRGWASGFGCSRRGSLSTALFRLSPIEPATTSKARPIISQCGSPLKSLQRPNQKRPWALALRGKPGGINRPGGCLLPAFRTTVCPEANTGRSASAAGWSCRRVCRSAKPAAAGSAARGGISSETILKSGGSPKALLGPIRRKAHEFDINWSVGHGLPKPV